MFTRTQKQVIALEKQLLTPEGRHSKKIIKELLAANFFEFGKDGRKYTRPMVLKHLPGEKDRRFVVSRWKATQLGPRTVLINYFIQDFDEGSHVRSWRSSIWQMKNKRWQMIFHQGTPVR